MGEVALTINPPSLNLRLKLKGEERKRVHMIEMYKLYFGVPGIPQAVRPHADLNDTKNMVCSAMHRYGRAMPEGTRSTRRRFLNFSKHFIRRYFPVLPADTDVSMETWLKETSYTGAQKEKLRQCFKDDEVLREGDFVADSFLKDEAYDTYKAPRTINAYPNRNKANSGPIQHALDKAIFKTKWSVKFMDMRQRAETMARTFGNRPVDTNDSSSMEAHHQREFAKLRVYWKAWVGQRLRGIKKFLENEIVKSQGVNVSKYRTLIAEIDEILMSGAMSTSSDNWVLNLCYTLFVLAESKWPTLGVAAQVALCYDWPAFFEGDDGVFDHFDVRPGLLEELGVLWKKVDARHFGEASFCSILVDPDELVSTTNPRKVLADFGIIARRYFACRDSHKLDLLRAKAMSYAHAYTNCPIIHEFCHYVLRCTRGRDVRWARDRLDMYRKSDLDRATASRVWMQTPNVAVATRIVVEKAYGITVEEQLRYEELFRCRDTLAPYPEMSGTPGEWRDYAARYCVDEDSEIVRGRTAVDAFILVAPPPLRPKVRVMRAGD